MPSGSRKLRRQGTLHHQPVRFAAIGGDFPALVLYTSGSTGAAQPVAKNLGQMAAEVAHLEKQFGALLGAADVISTVSHQHIYGLLFNVLWPLAAGRRIQASALSLVRRSLGHLGGA